MEGGSALRVVDAATHPVFYENPLVVAGAIGAYAGEPLLDNGDVIGAVSIFDSKPREFTAVELEILPSSGSAGFDSPGAAPICPH